MDCSLNNQFHFNVTSVFQMNQRDQNDFLLCSDTSNLNFPISLISIQRDIKVHVKVREYTHLSIVASFLNADRPVNNAYCSQQQSHRQSRPQVCKRQCVPKASKGEQICALSHLLQKWIESLNMFR